VNQGDDVRDHGQDEQGGQDVLDHRFSFPNVS
jgi:hypothetical protein